MHNVSLVEKFIQNVCAHEVVRYCRLKLNQKSIVFN